MKTSGDDFDGNHLDGVDGVVVGVGAGFLNLLDNIKSADNLSEDGVLRLREVITPEVLNDIS